MVEIIIVAVLIIIFVLFLISVFDPLSSQNKFWISIRKIRKIMDLGSYWFYNLCGIAAILYIIVMVIYSLTRN